MKTSLNHLTIFELEQLIMELELSSYGFHPEEAEALRHAAQKQLESRGV